MDASTAIESHPFGIAAAVTEKLHRLFAATPGLRTVWIHGSRARGNHRAESDIDLVLDMPEGNYAGLACAVEDLDLIYRVDLAHWQAAMDPGFRQHIEADRQVFWPLASASRAALPRIAVADLKEFQSRALESLGTYLRELAARRQQSDATQQVLQQASLAEDMADTLRSARDFPRHAWDALRKAGALPSTHAARPYSSRWDGAGRPVPNVCLKVPTGGGKTLLAAASIGQVFQSHLARHTGLVLWVVPNEAIYRQTLRTLAHRDHPYRQMLNVAGAGRVKILEKDSPLTRLDVESHLCVMLLMLASASRQSKDTLRFFRDRGNVLGFLPREDDVEAHWELLRQVPNLDVYGSPWAGDGAAAAQKGSIAKSSLGNVMRIVRPMVVIDEGHHAYTETALKTIDGFNPSFMLELSATPRVPDTKAGPEASGSNVLVDVRGVDLDRAEMIKLPIQVDVRQWHDWQSCLAASLEQLRALDRQAQTLQAQTSRYIRPILLVQVERTGKDQVEAGYIHAQHVREYLAQAGLSERQIREKTSEKDEIGDEELLAPTSDVRVIITKQALQEGWDCPFAYVLCALAASRGKRAMTQLVGRILRMPQTAKTGDPALDACYVFCHDARTGEVVHAIKQSLEGEGMGDLAISVRGDAADPDAPKPVVLTRRSGLDRVRIFLPSVTWVEPGVARRSLVYESDILARLPWERIDPGMLAPQWKPGLGALAANGEMRFSVDLSVLRDEAGVLKNALESAGVVRLERARIVQALLDLAPNPWLVWDWVDAVMHRLLASFDEQAVAASAASLIERLRIDLEAQRDRLAQEVFDALVAAGRIEFRLRADSSDYELPEEVVQELSGAARKLTRPDGLHEIDKSLLQPALRNDLNDFEAAFAGYLDQQAALRWWHRNVARSQYGLQGWKRNKVYPDFVFGFLTAGERTRVVVLETKGVQLAGNADTGYKRELLARLTEAFCDERFRSVGELALDDQQRVQIECDLVFDEAWKADMDSRYFGDEVRRARGS